MFLIPNLLPSRKTLQEVLIPEIRVSSNDVFDLDDDFVEDQKAKLTSQVSLQSFADEFEVINRSRLLVDRMNMGSRSNSFILFSIVPEGSFRDLSLSRERYSTSREASYTSLARLSEIRVDSRTNSCAKLEPVTEAETSDVSVSSEFLDVIAEPSAEVELFTPLSHGSIGDALTFEENAEEAMVKSDHNDKDSLPNIIVSKSTESGFISEESDTCVYNGNYDTKEIDSSNLDLGGKRLSGYSWNSSGSDISWKTQCSEADTEDSGYAEEITPGLKDDIGGGINTFLSHDNLKPDLTQERSHCTCDSSLTSKDNSYDFSGFEDNNMEHAHSLKQGPLIIYPGPLDYYSELLESKLEDQSTCPCEEDDIDLYGKIITDVEETIQQSDPSIPDLPPPPDIYSQMFEGILEEVNEYVEGFSELSSFHNSLKTWPKVSMTDLKLCDRETVV